MKCQFIKQNKDQCKMNAISSDVFCFTHNPKTKEAKRNAVIKGGKASKPHIHEELLPFMSLNTKEDYIQLLEQTMAQLQSPPMTHQKAYSMANVFNVLLKFKDRKIELNKEDGLAEIMRKALSPYHSELREIEAEQASLSNQDYLKILEDTINQLRSTKTTPQKVQTIARLSSVAFEILTTMKPAPAWFNESLLKNREKVN